MSIPQRHQGNNLIVTKVIKVTPELMAMILKNKDYSKFVPATLVRNDSGQQII